VERFNRTCQQMVKVFINENRNDWDDHLPLLLMAYRSSPQESTGMSPNMMMFGDELPAPIDLMVGAPPRHDGRYRCHTEYVEWLRKTMMRAHKFARDQLGVAAKRQKDYYDRRADPVQYAPGTFVWYWYPPKANVKFGIGYTGPHRVMACPTEIHCLIQLLPEKAPKRVHINQLKPHLGRTPVGWENYMEVPPIGPSENLPSLPVIPLADSPPIIPVPSAVEVHVPPVIESPALPESMPIELCAPETTEGEVVTESLTPVEDNAIGIRHSTRVRKPVVRLNI